ncbi:MAG TPA: ABC transporter ATP-binding protein [Kiritimatiellia bacterium]|nr:ABC transporter ATP-binding protein [Kiritimatiellia bacterium]HRZ12057.1 ABC transporter ATP-binding protein [Kiritimatiellia bacterium]HSA19612.1 ABC transporter ATP-binding protein [Kiritimatiellia bacterium]
MGALLQIQDLTVAFETDEGRLCAADRVSFDIEEGEVLGLVGESGCGKTVTALSILRLIPSPPGRIESGSILFRGRDLLALPASELRRVRGQAISMVFQDPMTALSPLHRVGDQLVETLQLHQKIGRRAARSLAVEWLKKVGIPAAAERMDAWPHQLSGGMRQRVMLAMALMLEPALIIADEPTTALDVTIQAQIFNLLLDMKDRSTSVLLITHDMGAVWAMCSRVVVMYASRVVEAGPAEALFRAPLHPYTQGLLRSMPSVQAPGGRLEAIPGQVPSPLNYPTGCHFSDRCPKVFGRCRVAEPPLYTRGEGRGAACFLLDEAGIGP